MIDKRVRFSDRLRAVAASLLLLATTGCARAPVAPLPVLPLPDTPALPAIKASEVQCLPEATWGRIVWRDLLLRQHIRELRAIITATHHDR